MTIMASAKDKTAKMRISEVFQMLPRQQHAKFQIPPQYIANRPSFFAAGKLMIYRECEVDVLQDPGETTCRPVWAWL